MPADKQVILLIYFHYHQKDVNKNAMPIYI